ncbi:MAG: LemA family protein [Parcubacteria group bacterium]|nr:LemA family protein [Parcubacteria group bacterium]
MSPAIITLIVVAVIIIALIALYNGLIRSRNRVQEAWSDIDVQLKRRYDLIPNLIETVKGYAKHESELFTKVTEARASAMQAHGTAEQGKLETRLSATIGNLFAVAENYPDLKANENFVALQGELSDTENKIQAARRFYNSQVLAFNNKLQVFPTNILASMMNFSKQEFFEVGDAKERDNVAVKF